MRVPLALAALAMFGPLALAAEGGSPHPFSEMDEGCANFSTPLTQEWAAWRKPAKTVAGNALAPQANPIAVGEKITLQLAEQSKIVFAARPGKAFPSKERVYGGQARVRTSAEGLYRVSLGAQAWVDLVDPQKKLPEPTASFERQKRCKEIFKVISFKLKPSHEYILEISSSTRDHLDLLITNAP